MNELKAEDLKYIISRLIAKAEDALNSSSNGSYSEFSAGRREAFYEMLDIVQSELLGYGQSLNDFGIDADLVSKYA